MKTNYLKNGDCFSLMNELPDKSIDLICTDIPYGEVNRNSNGLRQLDKKQADICNFNLTELVNLLCKKLIGSMYIFCGTEQVSELRAAMVANGMTTRLCIWEKANPSPMNGQYVWLSGIECCVYGKYPKATFNEHCKNTVWKYPCGKSKTHPTEKPLALIEYIIRVSSNEDDIVLDPFIGSGTTAIAAINLNRKYIGYEIDKTYYLGATQRIINRLLGE